MYLKRFALIAFALLGILFIASCSNKEPKAADTFANFTKAWNHQDWSKMYGMLSADAKKSISKDKFIKRYKDIYDGIEATHLKVTFDEPKKQKDSKDENKQNLTYHVKMNTLAGPLSFSGKTPLIKVKRDKSVKWTVNWTPSMILPDLKKDEVVRVKTIPAERGEIVDSNDKGLAINGKAIQIGISLKEMEGHADTKAKLAKLLNMSVTDIESKLGASWVTPETFVPMKTISATDTNLIDQAVKLPGVMTQDVPARVYPCGEACAHLVGYVGPITKEQLDKYKNKGYTESSVIGKKGLEMLYENKLRGQDGGEIYIADQNGNEVATVAKRDAKNGEDIQLTISTDVQKSLYNQLKGSSGTATAINPKTGDVLGLVSAPSFDPNQFVLGMPGSTYNKLLNDPNKPLLNRFSESFAPGSSFKPLVAAVALKAGAITPDTTMKINGDTWQKDKSWGTFHITRVDHLPSVNLRDALVYSDNIYFARTALKLGTNDFINGLKAFGLGEKMPFDYPLATSQVANDGKIDSDALLANSGYGQGQVSVNPLYLADTYTAFINDGNMVTPRLVKTDKAPAFWKKNVIPKDVVKTVTNDMVQVVQSPEGTAYNPRIPGLPPLAGKTGTAELKKKQGVKGRENGWMVAFNTNDPRVVVSMMIENVQDKGGSHYVVDKAKRAMKNILK